ncbi:MAG: hypothetical protein EBU07_15175 [Betaproteobacteria bacterium]|nr:hypothetical protein [Betaproteobacteria bacterium]NBS45910.1 hypothetical protein [Betaproteobacteria bacterium]
MSASASSSASSPFVTPQPVRVSYIGMEPSEALTAKTLQNVARLRTHYPDVHTCDVRIQLDHKHQRQGRPFTVTIAASLTDMHLGVDRVHKEDVYVALREAFDALKHQIACAVSRRRGEVKAHRDPRDRENPWPPPGSP